MLLGGYAGASLAESDTIADAAARRQAVASIGCAARDIVVGSMMFRDDN